MSVKPAYLNLNLTAARRLSDLRIQAQKLLSVSGNAATWRDVRKYGLHNWAPASGDLSQGFDEPQRAKQSADLGHFYGRKIPLRVLR